MYLSLNWLRDFVTIPQEITPKRLGELITMHTAEVEQVIDQGKNFENMVIGKIEQILPHPNADKLKICMTNIGHETKKIVCGGRNVKEGMLVPVALVGAQVKWHGQEELIKLEKATIRGEQSDGMICAGEEIGIGEAPEGGITDLSHLKVAPGTPLKDALGLNDVILEIENKSLTHRPDLWGHYGIARELSAIFKSKLKPFKIKRTDAIHGVLHKDGVSHISGASSNEHLDIKVENPKLCPRYMGVIINNIKITESPSWLKTRLEATGMRPICNIVDITNYVMMELGQPLHAFDKRLIDKGIIVRNANKGEKITTLDGVHRELDDNMLVIADHSKPLAIAGVMGGENSEISKDTTSLILESANFNAISVRQTSTKLVLRTEAVQRFEKGIDPLLAEKALLRTIDLILKICKKAEVSEIVDIKNFEDTKKEIELNTETANSKIGLSLSPKEIKEILKSLEFKTKKGSAKNTLKVEIPTFRAQGDIKGEDDLIEEIARIYGYDNIKPILPHLPINLPRENKERYLKHDAREILSGKLGFKEVYNYSFYSKEDFEKCHLEEKNHIKVLNFLSADQTHMRTSLLPNILKGIKNNLKNEDEFKIYEFGRTYKTEGEYWPKEEKKILAAIVQSKKHKGEIYYEIKGAMESFLDEFKFKNRYFLKKSENSAKYMHQGKSLEIMIDGKHVGYIYELHPEICNAFGIEAKVGIFELNFAFVCNDLKCTDTPNSYKLQANSYLASLGQKENNYTPLPKYPGNNFDVSAIFDENKLYQDLVKEIKKAYPSLIKEISLFDTYTGDKIGQGKKSLAFRILLQSDTKTITDVEMAEVQQKVFANLQNIGGKIRK